MPTATKASEAKKSAKKLAKKAQGTTHLAFLIDETGSMHGKEEAVIGGYNEFVATFKGKDDEADIRAWLGMFDAHPGAPRVRIKFAGKKIKEVSDLGPGDYSPRGMTPLNDAIVDTITEMDKHVGEGDKAMVVILTDGLENASEISEEDVKKLIEKREKDGWAFLYLGANQHAESVAAKIGLQKQGQAFNFAATKGGTTSSMRAATSLSESYLSAEDPGEYVAQASALYAATGGKLPEDDEDE